MRNNSLYALLLVCHADKLVFEYYVMYVSRHPIKIFAAVRKNSVVLKCSISQLEERKRETKAEKRRN